MKQTHTISLRQYRIIFLFFFISGFCGLLYEVVWVRLAFASFGIITPVMSLVISFFMLGLSIGSWAGGKWLDQIKEKTKKSSITLYAYTEILIGIGALTVPGIFSLAENTLLPLGETNSSIYLFLSAIMILFSILPFCILMGFTYPVMMSFLKETNRDSQANFSYLYFANTIGAAVGTALTALVFIELFGFQNTLWLAAAFNLFVAFLSLKLEAPYPSLKKHNQETPINQTPSGHQAVLDNPKIFLFFVLLFLTGTTSMSMEVVWIRAFAPVLGTKIYSFAGILSIYLLSSGLGSLFYRIHFAQGRVWRTKTLIFCLSVFAILPLILNDPRISMGIPNALTSIFPFCAALGYLTPKLIDRYSLGRPGFAGRAYAVNILGCILGPLIASYILLPAIGVKGSMIALGFPYIAFFLIYSWGTMVSRRKALVVSVPYICLFIFFGFKCVSYEEMYASYKGSVVRRDHTATVVSIGSGMDKKLLVNGIGTTFLTTLTKVMAHLPLSFLEHRPESGLVICLGMGTTFRSMLSWEIDVTAVELVPSVKSSMGYYFDDAEKIMNDPMGRIIIDDGRRFLKRTDRKFDVITVDPPPPIEAAGSSLLYSQEFYELAKKKMRKGGIFQQWFPGGELKILMAVARSLHNAFTDVRIYKSIGGWGYHFIASTSSMNKPTVQQMLDRMPKKARQDIMEWIDNAKTEDVIRTILHMEIPLRKALNTDAMIKITDDRPYNEYYLLRRIMDRNKGVFYTVF